MDATRGSELTLLAVLGVLAVALLVQYLSVILAAILLAYLLARPHRWLGPRIGERAAALGLIVSTIVLVVIPFLLLIGVVLTGLSDLAETILGEESQTNLGTVNELLQELYGSGFDIQGALMDYVQDGQVVGLLQPLLNTIGGAMTAFISLTILLLLTYALLLDGDDLLAWVGSVVPIDGDDWDELLERADKLMYAVVIGNVVIGVVDGTLVGIGLFLTGFSGVIFWTFIAIFMALIPLIGSMIVWVPAAAYLVLTGNVVAGALLLVYGGVVIGTVDNLLRSYVGGREANLNPALFIVGVFSGLALIGPMGLFFGPIVLAMSKHAFEVLGLGSDSDRPAPQADPGRLEKDTR